MQEWRGEKPTATLWCRWHWDLNPAIWEAIAGTGWRFAVLYDVQAR
jgi:hypothetical protein